MTEALIGLAALLILAFMRIPIAMVMILVGFAGMAYVLNPIGAMYNVGQTAYDAAIKERMNDEAHEIDVFPKTCLTGVTRL